MTKVAIVGSGFIGHALAISFARPAIRSASRLKRQPEFATTSPAFLTIWSVTIFCAASDPQRCSPALELKTNSRQFSRARSTSRRARPRICDQDRRVLSAGCSGGPNAVIASSASALLPSAFTESLAGRHRCLVVHPINPPYLVPAAEVVPAPWTSPETVETTRQFLLPPATPHW